MLLPWLCLTSVGAAPDGTARGAWPFGSRVGARARGRDLFNLGLLGAKAVDADHVPATAPPGGGMRRGTPSQGGDDDGPLRLRIEVLLPEGPAARCGLETGDVITGLGRRAFKEPCLKALAEALGKAEAGTGEVALRVERQGAGRAEKVIVRIPTGGKIMAKPLKGAGRHKILGAALRWLADRQGADGGYKQTLSGVNGSVVMAALAGLAWVAGGSDTKHGPYRENVKKAVDFVMKNAGSRMVMPGGGGMRGGKNWNQTNWGVAYGAIFLGELQAHDPVPKIHRALIGMGADLVKRQETSGGWAHGPGGPNALGYVELNIVSGLALGGIGLAGQAGYDVPKDALEAADAYLKASSSGDGGVGYSDKPGQKGQGNIGRTAGCWLGYQALGLGKSGWSQKMKKWIARGAGHVFGGHASLMQHILLGGVAAQALGGKAAKAFWATMARDLTLARAPDGSLQPRPWHESLSMGSNSDVTFGEVWTTAAWAVVLGCPPEKGDRPGLPYWMGLKHTSRR